jgi:hypothetical protein
MNRFLTSIRDFATLIHDVQKSDRDAVVAIVGDTGEGKSVFNIHLCKAVDKNFNIVRNLPYTKDELNRAIESFPEDSAIGVDEAVGLFYSRDFKDDQQIALLKKMDRSRDRRLLISLLIPDFFMLDKALRNGRVRFLVWVDRRVGTGEKGVAHAFIFQKERNVFNKEPWNLEFNVRLVRKGFANRSPNYIGEIEYYALTPIEYELYKEMKRCKRTLVEAEEWEVARRKAKRLGRRPEWLREAIAEEVEREPLP